MEPFCHVGMELGGTLNARAMSLAVGNFIAKRCRQAATGITKSIGFNTTLWLCQNSY